MVVSYMILTLKNCYVSTINFEDSQLVRSDFEGYITSTKKKFDLYLFLSYFSL